MVTLTEHWRWLGKECQALKKKYSDEEENDYFTDINFKSIIDTLIRAAETGELIENGTKTWVNIPVIKGLLVEKHLSTLGKDRLPEPNSRASLAAAKLYLQFIDQFAKKQVTSNEFLISTDISSRAAESAKEVLVLSKRIEECERNLQNLTLVAVTSATSLMTGLKIIHSNKLTQTESVNKYQAEFAFSSRDTDKDADTNQNAKVDTESDHSLDDDDDDDNDDDNNDDDDADSGDYYDTDNDSAEDTKVTSSNTPINTLCTPPEWNSIENFDKIARRFRWTVEQTLAQFVTGDMQLTQLKPSVLQHTAYNMVDDYERYADTNSQDILKRLITQQEKSLPSNYAAELISLQANSEAMQRNIKLKQDEYNLHIANYKAKNERMNKMKETLSADLLRLGKLIAETERWMEELEQHDESFLEVFVDYEDERPSESEQRKAKTKRDDISKQHKQKLQDHDDLTQERSFHEKNFKETGELMSKEIDTLKAQRAAVELRIRILKITENNIYQLDVVGQLLDQKQGFFLRANTALAHLVKTKHILKDNCWATYSVATSKQLELVGNSLDDLQFVFQQLSEAGSGNIFEGFNFQGFATEIAGCKTSIQKEWQLKCETQAAADAEFSQQKRSRRNKK